MPPGRRDPPALMIYMGGRWRSVPAGCGFAVARRGRLQELNSGAVRSALRRFQLCLSSKALLGPRLSFKKIPPSGGENSDEDVTQTETKETTLHNPNVRPCKRTRDTTSSEEPIQSVTTVATVHAAKQRKTSKNHQSHTIQLSSSESKSSEKSRTDLKTQPSKGISIQSPKKSTETSRTDLRYQKSKEIISSPKKSSMSSKILLDSPKKSLSLRRKPVEQTNSEQSSPILKSKDLSEKQISRYLQSANGKQNENPKKGDTIISDSDFETDQSEILKSNIKQKHSPKKINSNSDAELGGKNEKSLKNLKKFHKIGPKRRKLDQDSSESESAQKAENIFQRPNEAKNSQQLGTYKELEIDERDIELLRIFLQSHCSDSELLKFDADDEYKKKIFFQINPLVKIEWCPIIDRMLRRSQDSQITLTDFASNLGLQSVTKVIKTQRYKIRKRTKKSYIDSKSDSSSEDKENNDKLPRRTEKTKVLKERQHNRESNSENKVKESKNKVSNKIVLTRKRAESDSEESKAKENNKKAKIAQTRPTRTIHNTVETKSEKAKDRAKTENRKKIESDSEVSNTTANNKKAVSAKERTAKPNLNTIDSDSEASNAKENNKKVTNNKKLTKTEVRNEQDSDSEASNTKSNNKKAVTAKERTAKPNHNTIDSDSRKNNANIDRKEMDDTVELSSESETEKSVKAIKKTAKAKPVISSKRQRAHLEYSTLEDHAIVAWVSTGSRASRVNGNLLWRQFQDQYKQITGCRRTWHSLRNRYLRYILPKLGNLALPLSQQTRLRAAAATGEIKGRKVRSPRRNSIFTLPPRGAASRRPAAAYDDDVETDKKELPSTRSPRYSSLTRQFTRRQNLTRPSSELSDNSQRSNKLEVTDNKTEAKGNSPKKHRRIINSPYKKPNKATRNEHSDSDKESESPRDSSDSSSESENESKETNEPRRTRRTDANKSMSRNDTRQNATESKRLTRQSNILDGSDESKSLKSRVADKQKSTRGKIYEPSRNLNRHKSPSERNFNDSNQSVSQSKSPEINRRRSRRDTKYESADETNESKRRKSMKRSPSRKSNRNTSPSKQISKGSNTSVRQVSRKSKSPIKRHNCPDDPSGESDSSSGSVSEPRRRSNRINSPDDRSNRRKSNRLITPIKQNGRLSSDSSRRKSNRLTPNESNNKRRHSSESKRKSKLAKRDSLDVIIASDSSESFETKKVKKDLKNKVVQSKKTVDKQKMRRLFNPKAML